MRHKKRLRKTTIVFLSFLTLLIATGVAFATTYTYDSLGRLKSSTNSRWVVKYTYDAAGNMLSSQVATDDTTSPNTTIAINPPIPDGQNNYYITPPTITLSADETATIYYHFDSQEDTIYTATITAPQGNHILYWHSVDLAGNIETTKSQVFNVDSQSSNVSTLTFSLSVESTPTGGRMTAGTINFGELEANIAKTGSHRLSVTTNEPTGYTVTAIEEHALSSGSNNVADCLGDNNTVSPTSTDNWSNLRIPEIMMRRCRR
jgi:YD repeat-containing protein